MPANNPRTPPGWQRMRCNGGQMFRRLHRPLMVKKKGGTWRIWDLALDGAWDAREMPYDTWMDAVKALDENLEPRKENDSRPA